MLTPSTMIPLGTIAPEFNLIDVKTNTLVSLQNVKSPTATVIMFICNHCPYVIHIRSVLLDIVNRYQKKGISFIGISSNDSLHYPQDGPDAMRLEAEKHHYPFPYLFDETQAIARAYQAACTPDFYVFDKDLKCVYRGRFDNATPGNSHPVTGYDLSTALDCMISGKSIPTDQHVSVGCNIKWKK